ncbi:hypothetical protein SPI_07091 [Niveomyces insectorum RCEF 264]|uniref:Secreted protein n=1 Tax=Niveomyces insectorum RCEF 264 TaxID=1081102 RepID=A0A167Q9J3_9HYPO|nr:hypothetical protein SPI_07091 [Niveomyces insectorum RCEF 264]
MAAWALRGLAAVFVLAAHGTTVWAAPATASSDAGVVATTTTATSSAAPTDVYIAPNVLNITESGSGCPIGLGGMVHQMQNYTPVFMFTGWGLTLNGSAIPVLPPGGQNATSGSGSGSGSVNGSSGNTDPGAQDTHVVRGSVAKFCKELVAFGGAPVGYQVHIGQVTVSGYAELDPGSFVGVRVNTRFDRAEAGRANATVSAAALRNGTFSVTLVPDPVTWSPCINSTGLLPVVYVRTSVSVNGTALPSGTYSSGRLGGASTDMTRGLTMHFVPEWRPCPAASLAPSAASPSASSSASPSSASSSTASSTPVKDPPIQAGPPTATPPPMSMGGMD